MAEMNPSNDLSMNSDSVASDDSDLAIAYLQRVSLQAETIRTLAQAIVEARQFSAGVDTSDLHTAFAEAVKYFRLLQSHAFNPVVTVMRAELRDLKPEDVRKLAQMTADEISRAVSQSVKP